MWLAALEGQARKDYRSAQPSGNAHRQARRHPLQQPALDLGCPEPGIGPGRREGHGDGPGCPRLPARGARSEGRFRLAGPSRAVIRQDRYRRRSEEHTSELQSLMRISYAVFCLKKKKKTMQLTSLTTTDTPQNTYEHK